MIIKLLQWNIWYKEDPSNIAKVIKQIDPDIACLQEVTTTSPEILGIPQIFSKAMDHADINYKQAQGWKTDKGFISQGNAIFSKFKVKKRFFEYLQDESLNPTEPDKEGRVYVEATVDINGYSLTVGTTHLSYAPRFTDSKVKDKEMEKLEGIISRKQKNYVLTGDFNSTPESKVITKIEEFLYNCGPNYSKKTWTTKPFDLDGFSENDLNWRLDYVFATKDIKAVSAEVVKTNYSDHLPLLVQIEID